MLQYDDYMGNRRDTLSKILYWLVCLLLVGSTACFALSVLAHLLSFLPFSLPIYNAFPLLALGFLVFFLPMVFVQATYPGVEKIQGSAFGWVSWRDSIARRRQFDKVVTQHVPRWALTLVQIIFAYAMITMLVFLVFLPNSMEANVLLSLRYQSVFCMTLYSYCSEVFYSRARDMELRLRSSSLDRMTDATS